MPHQASFIGEPLKREILEILKANPEGLTGSELQVAVYGDKHEDQMKKTLNARVHFYLKNLNKRKEVRRSGGGPRAPWVISDGRPEPVVADIPPQEGIRRGRRPGSKNASSNGTTDGGLVLYILRNIRQQLAELEAAIH